MKILLDEAILEKDVLRDAHNLRQSLRTKTLSSPQQRLELRTLCDNFERKSMSDHKVFCAKLKQELPGLPEPPFDSELGKKIYDNVSQQAWGQWMEHCKMLLNEYRLNPARRQDQEVIVTHMEQFFFGEGAAHPAEYVPPAQ
jgi:Fe-S cluster biosynthesis and repair protein YggX